MARHEFALVRAVTGVQVRFATDHTGEQYVTGKCWQKATLSSCPWHPEGGCGFARHGTYSRVRPPGCHIARWYCPKARRTVSALPDCLAAQRSGTLAELEAELLALERAKSVATAAESVRTDIELPGALRYLTRLRRDIYRALAAVRGLFPARFAGVSLTLDAFLTLMPAPCVLQRLRVECRAHVHDLPAPLGFNPRHSGRDTRPRPVQHQAGADPPCAFLDALGS